MPYSPSDPTSQITETPAPQDFGTATPFPPFSMPLWCMTDNCLYPENSEEIEGAFREARSMVDRELMEAIYVMLRVRA